MGNVVKFPEAPEWAKVDAKMVEALIAKGYLRRDQRNNWCAVLMAFNNAFDAAVFDLRPELSLQEVIIRMLEASQKPKPKPPRWTVSRRPSTRPSGPPIGSHHLVATPGGTNSARGPNLVAARAASVQNVGLIFDFSRK
jgi:hypothetical protein